MAAQDKLTFTQADVDAFRRLSHDSNPLHIDALYASRTPYGKPVVYGVLGILGMLRNVLQVMPISIVKLTAKFIRPMFIGETYQVDVASGGDNVFILKLMRSGVPRVRVQLTYAPWRPSPAEGPTDGNAPMTVARDEAVSDTIRMPPRGEYVLGTSALEDLRKSLRFEFANLPQAELAALCWSSYFTGMEFPGKQAALNALEISFTGASKSAGSRFAFSSAIAAEFEQANAWKTRATLTADGSELGTAELFALRRPDPVRYSYDRLREIVGTGEELKGKVVLVTGASRGLGSVLAIGCALHGANVAIQYQRNDEAALEVSRVIDGLGRKAYTTKGDLRQQAAFREAVSSTSKALGSIDILIHGAFAPILPMEIGEIDKDVIDDFIGGNIAVAVAVYQELLSEFKGRGGTVVNVSSIYTVTPPKTGKLAHYVAAKAAIEGLTRAIAAECPNIRFITLRPPRILTDQTNTNVDASPKAEPYEIAALLISALSNSAPTATNYLELG